MNINTLEFDLGKISMQEVINTLKKCSPGSLGEISVTAGTKYMVFSEDGENEVCFDEISFRKGCLEFCSFIFLPSAITLESSFIKEGLLELTIGIYQESDDSILEDDTKLFKKDKAQELIFEIVIIDPEFSNMELVMDFFKSIKTIMWDRSIAIGYF